MFLVYARSPLIFSFMTGRGICSISWILATEYINPNLGIIWELLPPLDHEDMIALPRLHLGVLWVSRRARLERERGVFEFFYQGAADLPAETAAWNGMSC